MRSSSLVVFLIACGLCSQIHAHPPVPLNEWSARLAIEDLQVTVEHQESEMNRLLLLTGKEAERILAAAQESVFKGDSALAIKHLMALTIVPAFEKHRARASVFQWLGIAYHALGFDEMAQTYLLKSYSEPRQTQSTRIETVRSLLEIRRPLPHSMAENLWQNRRALIRKTNQRDWRYPFCRALYRSDKLKIAADCFRQPQQNDYDHIRAQYFLGVIMLRNRKNDAAKLSFLDARKRVLKQLQPPSGKSTSADIRSQITTVTERNVDESASERWSDLSIRIDLALARLAAAQENWTEANLYYRHIPPGHPTFFEAAREWALVLDRLGRPQRAAAVLISVGQSSTPTAAGLKQQMWRAELLGRGALYTSSLQTYAHIDSHARQIQPKLISDKQPDVDDRNRAMWLIPTLGHEYGEMMTEIERLQTELNTLTKDFHVVANQTKMAFKQKSARLKDVDELTHRLNDIMAGLETQTLKQKYSGGLRKLGARIDTLKLQNQRLQSHYSRILPEQIGVLTPLIRSSSQAMSATLEVRNGVRTSVYQATRDLLDTLSTQAGLGQLNVLVWKKEAVAQERSAVILEKQRLTKWIESDDPAHSPAQSR